MGTRKRHETEEEKPVAADEDVALKNAYDAGYVQCAKDVREMHGDNPNPTLNLFLCRVIDGKATADPAADAHPEGGA